tara:strand:+ start:89 stop:283 length:195 start_codon:yes stop_codon:yes gene_type:complete
MQASVVKVAVSVGDTIEKGDLVVILEAMKMEQPLTAHRSGKIKQIGVAVGDTVSAGTLLLEIED